MSSLNRLRPLFSAVTVIIALFAATAQAAPNASGVYFSWGGITYLTHPDGVSTGYTIDLGFPLLPNPAALGNMTVTATGPGGFSRSFTNNELYVWQGESEIWEEFASLPQGLYIFTLSDGINTTTRTDRLTAPTIMPVVDLSTLQRVRKPDGSYRFSWRPVVSQKPYFYRLTILNAQGEEVYSGSRRPEVVEDVAAGLLADGVAYWARIEVHDAPSFDLLNNRSNSSWFTFTPQASEYDPNRLLFRYAMATNRVESNGSASVDFNFGLSTPQGSAVTSISSATITGPNGFSAAAALAADGQNNFRTNVATPLATGVYTLRVTANGREYQAYAALTPVVTLPVVDSATYQVADLGNGNVRFSWGDPNHTGPLYYRVQVQDANNGANQYLNTGRVNRSYVDIPLAQLNTLSNRRWRVEVYDSSSGTAARNRRNSDYVQLVIPAYDPSAPVLDLCTVSSVTDHDGAALTYFAAEAHAGGTISQLSVSGPNALSRNLLGGGEILEQGSPAAGLYTCRATNSSQKTALRHNYQPSPHPIAPVDFRTVSVAASPAGAPVITWAPVASDLPLWYEVEFLQLVSGVEVSQDFPQLLSQTTYAIPQAMLQLPGLLIRINAHDGSNATTVNNSSMSVVFAYEGAGFDYASLTDADGDGYASNVNLGGSATLTVAGAGTGAGSVHSAPEGISCASGSPAGCSASFSGSVTLTATPSTGSIFAGWQGACTNQSGSCTVAMNGSASVGAIFNLVPPVKVVAGADSYFALLQPAYQAAPSASQILAREGVFAEALSCNRPVSVAILGGYDGSFGSVTGVSRIVGSLKIGAGTVRVRNLSVR